MGTKTSVYLADDLAEQVRADPRSIPDLIRHALAVKPILIEENKEGDFTVHWYCAVPEMGAKFKVLRDHWLESGMGTGRPQPVREIYEIEITQSGGE